jgi:hypothetical protein
MQQYVNNEYQQYVKSDDNLYSRKNLREIHQSLQQDPDPGTKGTALPVAPPAENDPPGQKLDLLASNPWVSSNTFAADPAAPNVAGGAPPDQEEVS